MGSRVNTEPVPKGKGLTLCVTCCFVHVNRYLEFTRRIRAHTHTHTHTHTRAQQRATCLVAVRFSSTIDRTADSVWR